MAKKDKNQMIDFERQKSSAFITKIEFDEINKKLYITRADASVDELDYTEHNLQFLLLQMEQQVIKFMKEHKELIEKKDKILFILKGKTVIVSLGFVLLNLLNLISRDGESNFLSHIITSNVWFFCYAYMMVFALDQNHTLSKFIEIEKMASAFKRIEAYQYYLEHKDYFSACEIENENGEIETRELLNINDVGLGNFTLEDLKRIRDEENGVKKKIVF